MKNTPKKLKLTAETIARLTDDGARKARGAVGTQNAICDTCTGGTGCACLTVLTCNSCIYCY